VKLKLSNLIFNLRNKINNICCFRKTTFNTEPKALTYTYVSWNYFKMSGIYRISNNAWLRVLLKRILHLRLAPDRAVSVKSAQCLHMILCDTFVLVHTEWRLEFFQWTIERVHYAAYGDARIA